MWYGKVPPSPFPFLKPGRVKPGANPIPVLAAMIEDVRNMRANGSEADFYGLKKIPDENDIPPEYHFHPDYALYGVKFFSYFTQKNFIRPGSGRLDETIPSDFVQMEVNEIWRCTV